MVFKKIVVAIDGSKQSARATKAALELAKKYNAKLTLMSVVIETYGRYNEMLVHFQKIHSQILKRAKRAKIKADSVIVPGVPARKILDYAKKAKADLIVLGKTGVGLAEQIEHAVIGSVAKAVSKKAPCSVLIVK